MTPEENKRQIRRWFDAVNAGTAIEGIADFYTADYVLHDPSLPGDLRGHEALAAFMTAILAAFPDGRYTIDELVAEGDKVAGRVTGRATHRGEFAGVGPTNREITVSLMSILRFEQGKIAEEWEMVDSLGMLQQIGAIPSPQAV